jgi:hypothetical protein
LKNVAVFLYLKQTGGEVQMKKAIILNAMIITAFVVASPVYAADGDVTKVQNFIESIIQVLVTIAGLVAAVFFVLGGFGYITSSGNPEHLDRSKKTIVYSAVGLSVSIGAFVLSKIVTDLAQTAFGK